MKPTKWATKMLRVLISEYNNNPARFSDPGLAIDIWELAVKAGIISDKQISIQDFYCGHPFRDAIETILKEMARREWIGTDKLADGLIGIYLLPKGIDEGTKIIRPWYHKVWDFLKGHIITIVVAVITALIITLLANWLLNIFD